MGNVTRLLLKSGGLVRDSHTIPTIDTKADTLGNLIGYTYRSVH